MLLVSTQFCGGEGWSIVSYFGVPWLLLSHMMSESTLYSGIGCFERRVLPLSGDVTTEEQGSSR